MDRNALILLLSLTMFGCQLFRSSSRSKNDSPSSAEGSATTLPTSKDDSPGAGSIYISPSNTKIEFTGSNLLLSQTGSFTKFEGAMKLNGGDPTKAKIDVDIDMQSTTTAIDQQTKHLKAKDFFDVANYPKAEFHSERIMPSAEQGLHQVIGKLKFHGVEKQISFPARFTIQEHEVSFDGTVALKQTEFGMTESVKLTKDEVKVRVMIKAVR